MPREDSVGPIHFVIVIIMPREKSVGPNAVLKVLTSFSTFLHQLGSSVAEWLRRWTTNLGVPGSIPRWTRSGHGGVSLGKALFP